MTAKQAQERNSCDCVEMLNRHQMQKVKNKTTTKTVQVAPPLSTGSSRHMPKKR